MQVFPRDDKKAIHVIDFKVNEDGTMPLDQAMELYNLLTPVLQDCGVQLKLKLEVPPPSKEKIEAAAYRVAHLRRNFADKPWHDAKVAMEIVMRTLEVCR